MTSMIERVARAIATANTDEDGEGYDVLARAAIQAMREPTTAMKSSVRDAGGVQALAYANASWPTMIDAALKETTA